MSFPSTHPALARALAAKNYSDPTAVQSAVLEDRASGKDLLVSAQTGSGKTVAFGLSLAPTLLGDAERFDRAGEPLALVIAPTRELAMQVHRELTWLYAETGARIVTCVGGMDPRAEARQLGFGTHVVVGTPGRLRDHIERGRLDLSKLKAVVLDEADEMLDLGFREDLEFILDRTPAERRTLLFSATLPRDIQTLAGNYQRDAVRIETIRQNEQHADIEYFAARVMPNDVENAIVNTIRYHDAKAIVFCATREAVKRTHARLVERGFAAVAISGELTQAERTNAIVALRDGRARILVATDVAARGLDLPDLALVIHADLPNDRETLLHRSGRTGRAGKKGMSILIVPHFRRRRAEMLLGAARVKASWGTPPSAEAVHARDRERFLADPIFTDASAEGEDEAVRLLQSMRTPDEIARALLRLN
ncbi:MAG TPA: DEAD/DEAH box helicase, partial [Hyphomicrobiaceae bacterium]|nr:DEAD/DEAH box helicase [Hyphomicrobiaceae bacterium]